MYASCAIFLSCVLLDPYQPTTFQVNVSSGIINTAFGTPLAVSSTSFGDGGPASLARFYYPWSVASDGSQGYYIADFAADNVRRIFQNLTVVSFAGTSGSGVRYPLFWGVR